MELKLRRPTPQHSVQSQMLIKGADVFLWAAWLCASLQIDLEAGHGVLPLWAILRWGAPNTWIVVQVTTWSVLIVVTAETTLVLRFRRMLYWHVTVGPVVAAFHLAVLLFYTELWWVTAALAFPVAAIVVARVLLGQALLSSPNSRSSYLEEKDKVEKPKGTGDAEGHS
jgi:hypothetical protein